MKAHGACFELPDPPVLELGAMMRKGRVGAARGDGVTSEMAAEIAAIGRELLDEDALAWTYRGSSVPR